MAGTIETLENLNVKNIVIPTFASEKKGRNDVFVIWYNDGPLRLRIDDINLSHKFSGILDSRKASLFQTKDINPLYVYFNNNINIGFNTEKLKQLSEEIKYKVIPYIIKHTFINDSKLTFKFDSSYEKGITTEINSDFYFNKRTDELIDLIGNLNNSKIDVVVRFEIISNSFGFFIGMIMEKLTVKKNDDEVKNLSDQMNSCALKTYV